MENIRIAVDHKEIIFDLSEMKTNIDGCEYPLDVVNNSTIFEAISNKQILIQPTAKTIKKSIPLYYCVRKLKSNISKNGRTYYMDMLLYKKKKDTFCFNYSNRSLGHKNDKNEIELHQVLSGEILEIVIDEDKIYVGVFSKGEYFEIPNNMFHCTYILKENTVVANIYSNIFWGDDYKLKPYFEIINDINIVISKKDSYIIDSLGTKIEIKNKQIVAKSEKYWDYTELNKLSKFPQEFILKRNIFEIIQDINQIEV